MIKKGDNVIIIAGKDKGKKSKILRVLGDRVIVEGVGEVSKRRRPRKAGEKGQTIKLSTPVHASNVAIFCATCKKGVRREHKH